jgi:hypothetical protein
VEAAETTSDGGGIFPRGARGRGKRFVPALRPSCLQSRRPRPPEGYGRPGPTSPCLVARPPR